MKKYLLLFLLTFSGLFAYPQDYLTLGNNCYEEGDYDCARDNYQKYLELSPNDQDIVTLQKRAGECAIYKMVADKAFNNRNIFEAKSNYEAILSINSHDSYAKGKIEDCNKILVPVVNLNVSEENISYNSSGGSQTVTVTTNVDGYTISQLPPWCFVSKGTDHFELSCSANSSTSSRTGELKVTARDKEVTIYVTQKGIETTLNVSSRELNFEYGGGSRIITVTTNVYSYEVTSIPDWCTVNKSGETIAVHCKSNNANPPRKDWFKVSAGDKEIRVNVYQVGIVSSQSTDSRSSSNQIKQNSAKQNSCFNCPTTKYNWGLSIGRINKYLDQDETYIGDDVFSSYYPIEIKGIRAGLKFEPLFKYGFGLNTGIFYEHFSQYLDGRLNGSFPNSYDGFHEFYQHAINIPIHLEYRLNFSRYFNLFAFGGAGFDGIWDSFSDEMKLKSSLEYGGGLRIDHLQFNIGQSLLVNNAVELQNFNKLRNQKYKNLIFSVAYMF